MVTVVEAFLRLRCDASVNSHRSGGDKERGLLGDVERVVCDPFDAPCDH